MGSMEEYANIELSFMKPSSEVSYVYFVEGGGKIHNIRLYFHSFVDNGGGQLYMVVTACIVMSVLFMVYPSLGLSSSAMLVNTLSAFRIQWSKHSLQAICHICRLSKIVALPKSRT